MHCHTRAAGIRADVGAIDCSLRPSKAHRGYGVARCHTVARDFFGEREMRRAGNEASERKVTPWSLAKRVRKSSAATCRSLGGDGGACFLTWGWVNGSSRQGDAPMLNY